MTSEDPKEQKVEEEKKLVLSRLTDDDLRTFVNDFVSGQIFSSAHVRSDDLAMLKSIFMPLGLGGLAGYPEEELKDIGLLYEYLDAQGSHCVNGYPIFMSFRLMCKADWARAHEAIVLETERRKNIELPQAVVTPEK